MEEITCKVTDVNGEMQIDPIKTQKVAENNELEATQEQELAKKIAELVIAKRGLFAYIVRELYITIKEDLTGGQEAEEKEDASLENFFNDNMSNVVKKIREAYPDVYNAIEEEVIENLDVDDLDDDFKERVAQAYMSDKGNDSIARDCFSNMGSWEQKDFIKDCIDDL